MHVFSIILGALALGSCADAHMALLYPPPFRSKFNPNVASGNIDYNMVAPLQASGSDFPCKGYQIDLGTAAGASVATWNAGSAYNFTVSGGATHGGGSCQASLSYDKGATFTVIQSYQGSCPLSDGATFDFTIPADAPNGNPIFSWTWFNKIGNREIYMNCASVTITGSGSAPVTPFASRPNIFEANMGNGCTTVEGKEVQFPNPGPGVVNKPLVSDNSGSFNGSCAPAAAPNGGVSANQPSTLFTTTSTTSATPVTITHAPRDFSASTITTTIQAPTAVQPVATDVSSGVPIPGDTGAFEPGSACPVEGMFNCVGGPPGGVTYQQCAEGVWTQILITAIGTQCVLGQSMDLPLVNSNQKARGVAFTA